MFRLTSVQVLSCAVCHIVQHKRTINLKWEIFGLCHCCTQWANYRGALGYDTLSIRRQQRFGGTCCLHLQVSHPTNLHSRHLENTISGDLLLSSSSYFSPSSSSYFSPPPPPTNPSSSSTTSSPPPPPTPSPPPTSPLPLPSPSTSPLLLPRPPPPTNCSSSSTSPPPPPPSPPPNSSSSTTSPPPPTNSSSSTTSPPPPPTNSSSSTTSPPPPPPSVCATSLIPHSCLNGWWPKYLLYSDLRGQCVTLKLFDLLSLVYLNSTCYVRLVWLL